MNQDSLVIAVVSPEAAIHEAVGFALQDHLLTSALWSIREYPALAQLAQIREASGGCVIFLDFADALIARSIAAELDRSYPTAATVAVYPARVKQDLFDLMQLGIREIISLPAAPAQITRVCERAARRLRREPVEESGASVYAFLPARPGSGTTTVALHSAAAAARLSGQPILLADFDLRLGMTSFLLKLHSDQSVTDALLYSGRLDETLWDRLVCHRGALDILGSAPCQSGRESHDPSAPGLVLDYASKKYCAICVDLPGEMRDHELDALQRAKEIFLVCTPDVGAMHMAKRKADLLGTLNLRDRLSLVLNRADMRGALGVREVEDLLSVPVRFTVPSAEVEIAEATHKAVAIEGRSAIAGQFEKIARRLTAIAGAVETPPRTRRFIDFFSVTPVRDKAGLIR